MKEMSKSFGFFILTLFVVASIESVLISSTRIAQESKLFNSAIPAPSPADNDDCSGLTPEECLIKKGEDEEAHHRVSFPCLCPGYGCSDYAC